MSIFSYELSVDVHVNSPFLASFRSRVLQRRHNATAQAPTTLVPQAPPTSVMILVLGQFSYPLFSHCSASCPIMTASVVVLQANSLPSGHFLRMAHTGIRLKTDSNSTLKDDQSRARCCCSREPKLIDLGASMVSPLCFHRLSALRLPPGPRTARDSACHTASISFQFWRVPKIH